MLINRSTGAPDCVTIVRFVREKVNPDGGLSTPRLMSLAELDHVEVGRPLPLHAGQRCVADCAGKVRLAFLERLRVVRGGHRQFAQKRVIQLLDLHRGIFTGAGRSESGWLAPVQFWDNTYFRQV